MNIGQAVEALRDGKKLRREIWGRVADAYREAGVTAWSYLYFEERPGHAPAVMVCHNDGKASHFAMIDAHLLAEDWVIYDDSPDADIREGRTTRHESVGAMIEHLNRDLDA